MESIPVKIRHQGGQKRAHFKAGCRKRKLFNHLPLCHPLSLRETNIKVEFDERNHRLVIRSYCEVEDKTGCEMEAMVGASVAALNVYDMCKGISKGITIEKIELLEKSGGKSGDYRKS